MQLLNEARTILSKSYEQHLLVLAKISFSLIFPRAPAVGRGRSGIPLGLGGRTPSLRLPARSRVSLPIFYSMFSRSFYLSLTPSLVLLYLSLISPSPLSLPLPYLSLCPSTPSLPFSKSPSPSSAPPLSLTRRSHMFTLPEPVACTHPKEQIRLTKMLLQLI